MQRKSTLRKQRNLRNNGWKTWRAMALAAVSLCGVGAAKAQDIGEITPDGNLRYYISHVPDIDQRRAAAPGIEGLPYKGSEYCVPTSALNWVGYFGAHGYIMPTGLSAYGQGPNDVLDYNIITQDILQLAFWMGTSPTQGTDNGAAAFQVYLDAYAPNTFVVSAAISVGAYSPELAQLGSLGIAGNFINLGIGFYARQTNSQLLLRVGGHAVTMVGLDTQDGILSGSGDVILHDPAIDLDMTWQSYFTEQAYQTQPVFGLFGGKNGQGSIQQSWRTQEELLQFPRAGAYIDGYMAVAPQWGLLVNGPLMTLHNPYGIFMAGSRPSTVTFRTPDGANVADIALDAVSASHPYLTIGSDTVWSLDQLTGESTPLAEIAQPKHLCIGGMEHNIYVASATDLIGLRDDGTEFGEQRVAAAFDGIFWDGAVRRIAAYASHANTITLFDENLAQSGQYAVGARVPGSVDQPIQFALDMKTDTYLLHRDGSPQALRVAIKQEPGLPTRVQTSLVNLQGVTAARGLATDRLGNLYTTVANADGTMVTAVFDPEGARIKSAFAGTASGPMLRMLLPYNNFDPATMTGPSYYNVLPTPNWR
jgi:hypothetical protein